MNQRALAVVSLYAPTAAKTALDTGSVTDIGSGYANVGRREMKLIVAANLGANTTQAVFQVQEATTSGGNDAANISGASVTLTTTGIGTVHFSTIKRYVRIVHTPAGTTASVVALVAALVEDRAS